MWARQEHFITQNQPGVPALLCVFVCVCGGCQGFLFFFVLFVFRIQNCTPILGYLASLRRLGRNLGLFFKQSFIKTFVIAFCIVLSHSFKKNPCHKITSICDKILGWYWRILKCFAVLYFFFTASSWRSCVFHYTMSCGQWSFTLST